MIKIISLFTIYNTITNASNKRLLQQFTDLEVYGAYKQKCKSPQSDFACQFAQEALTDQDSGVLECGVDYSCCLCGSITCGSQAKYCDTFKAGADYSAFGVQNINIIGEVNGNGAVIDCNGQYACGGTHMTGTWIDTVRCSSDGSCANSLMEFTDSKGIICGKGSCVGATVKLKSNRGGELICAAETACLGATIEIDGILDVKCNGPQACENTNIVVNDPSEQFILDCNGDFSCNNLDLTINVPGPADGCAHYGNQEPFFWKGINCGASNACVGMHLTVVNNGCRTVIIEDLQCSPGGACTGAVFNLNSGTGFGVEVKNCMCGPSCRQAVGLDACYNNVQLLDCPDIRSCASQTQTIVNPGNDFLLKCGNTEACDSFKLNIIISGASQNLIQRFTGYSCTFPMACQNAIINIENEQTDIVGLPVLLSVNKIECTADKSCNGATFITGNNVQIDEIVCVFGACDNCMVKQRLNSVGVACTKFVLSAPMLPVIPNGPVVVLPKTTRNPIQIIPSTTTTTSTTSTSTSTSSTTTTIAAPVNTITFLNPNWVPIEPISTEAVEVPMIPVNPVIPVIPNVQIPVAPMVVNPVIPAIPNVQIPNKPAEIPPF